MKYCMIILQYYDYVIGHFSVYNPGQNTWDINATAGENDTFSLPPSPPVQCWRYGFKSFSTQSTLLRGGGTAETGSFNNISKHL